MDIGNVDASQYSEQDQSYWWQDDWYNWDGQWDDDWGTDEIEYPEENWEEWSIEEFADFFQPYSWHDLL